MSTDLEFLGAMYKDLIHMPPPHPFPQNICLAQHWPLAAMQQSLFQQIDLFGLLAFSYQPDMMTYGSDSMEQQPRQAGTTLLLQLLRN